MKEKKEAAEIFGHIVDIVRAVRSNRKIELFSGGMEKLNFAQITALFFLYESKGMTMSELAAIARVQLPTMTDIMSKLVSSGYAERKHSAKDRRQVIMSITEKGRKLVDINRGINIENIEKYMSKLNHVEKKIALVFVRKAKDIIINRFEQ